MSKTVTSGSVTFMDLTDSRKLDVYITSNLPTTQIYNQNTKTYTPNWSTTNLQLSADVFLDSKEVTTDQKTSIVWYKRVGTQTRTEAGRGVNLIITSNQLTDDNSIITYICEATYTFNNDDTNPPTAHTEIVFTRVDTGIDGSDAPAVVAQYSVDGVANWTSTLNTATHKYIRHSYDGGKTWSVVIKMVGDDGTSVKIVGTATSATQVSGTDYYTLVYSSASITSAELGDAYLYDGDLYVCADSRDGQDYFINVGNIQGPSGNDGKSSYIFIRYATDANGTNMSTSPSGKTYMGVYTSDTNVAPTTANSYTWSKFVGDNAKSIVLSGNSQVFKVSQSSAITPSSIKVTAQAFNTTITNWTYSTNGGQIFLSSVPTGVSRSGNIVTINGSAIESNSIVIKASDGEVEDVFTVYKVVDGANGNPGSPGAPAPIAFLTNENITFSANAQGQITGTTLTSNVVAYNGVTKVTPAIGAISNLPNGMTIAPNKGTAYSNVTPTTDLIITDLYTDGALTTKVNKSNLANGDSFVVGNYLCRYDSTNQNFKFDKLIVVDNEVMFTIAITNNSTLGSASSNMGVISVPIVSPVSTVLSLTWSKVNTGATGAAGLNAYTVMLTNESHIFTGDIANAVAGSATTQILAYLGAATQTVTISSVNGKTASTTDADTGIAGLKFRCSALSGVSPTITFTCTTDFTNANGSIPIVLSVGGVSFTKMFTYSIAFKGSTGDTGPTGPTGPTGSAGVPATSYWLVSSASAVQKTSTGTITVTPSTLTFTGKSQTGTATPIDYACRWIIAYSTDGANYTNLYTSSANEASKSITVATTYKTIRARMYLAGGTATLLDEQIIPIVSDGAKGDKGNQGDRGVGISSVTVTYGTSTSASTQPTSWQTTLPTVAEGSYLWTRTVTDYTDDTVADTVTLTYAKQGVKGDTGSAGSSVTVSSIQYQAGSSATTAPTGTWSNAVVTVAEGSYLWTKTTFSDGKVAYGVAKQGAKGSAGADAYTVILTNESHVFAGNVSSAIASSATTQVMAYKGSASQSVTIVSVDGKTASTSSTATSITGLSFACSALSGTTPTITFTCTTSFISPSGTIPIVVKVDGVTITKMFTYGIAFKGATGSQGVTGTAASLVDITPSAHYFKSTTGKDGTFTPDYIYLYPRFQTVTFSKWEYSVNGGTTWVAASGANGLSIGTYNSVANTLRIAKTSTLYTDTVTSISFRCVSSNASVYDTVSIAKIYDVVDLEIGGRNLLLNSGTPVTNEVYNIKKYDLTIKPTVEEQYTITIKGKLGDNKTSFSAYNSGGNVALATLTRVGTSDIYQKTFNWKNNDRTDLDTSVFIYTMPNSVTTESTIEWIKLEKGNKATDWSPAPEDLNNITFQIYAPNGYLLTNELQSISLQTFAYEGSLEITSGATFQWSQLVDDVWIDISGATNTTLTVTKTDVLKAKSYRCIMTYKGKSYTSTITVQDKTDAYNSIMCISSNARGNDCYWVLYTLVYTDAEEVDPLLGPISINAPTSPVIGDYWYAVDETSASVQLKKYDGTSWVNSTDTQSLSYYWDIVNNGSEKVPFGDHSKVQVVSCNDFTATATLVCGVNNVEDGLLTQSSLSLTDASDPIVSITEPISVVDGQIWIKPNNNGTYIMSIWDATKDMWVVNDMDTRTKVHTSKPSTYSVGDLWITASDTEHSDYLEGTLLMASTSSSTFSESHWSTTLKYDKDLDSIKKTLNDLSQYVNITSEGLKIGAQSASGEISPFTSLFTSTELAFYQNSDKLLTLSNNQLTAPHIVVEDDLEVGKTISLGNLNLTIETNGSFSFTVTK